MVVTVVDAAAIRHRPMETPSVETRVETPFSSPHGVAVPPLLDVRIASLMSHFSQLSPHAQKRFMALLNEYLYASPVQRRQLRRDWEHVSEQACACGEHHDEIWLGPSRGKA